MYITRFISGLAAVSYTLLFEQNHSTENKNPKTFYGRHKSMINLNCYTNHI